MFAYVPGESHATLCTHPCPKPKQALVSVFLWNLGPEQCRQIELYQLPSPLQRLCSNQTRILILGVFLCTQNSGGCLMHPKSGGRDDMAEWHSDRNHAHVHHHSSNHGCSGDQILTGRYSETFYDTRVQDTLLLAWDQSRA